MFSIQFKAIRLLAGFFLSFTGPCLCFGAVCLQRMCTAYVYSVPLLYFSLLNISLKTAEKGRNMWQV